MRTFRHWTPTYLKDRIAMLYYEHRFPDYPWLTPSANEVLDSYLVPTDIGLEFGSGRSTPWLARRLHHLTSVEHDPNWATQVREKLAQAGDPNVDYRLIPIDNKRIKPHGHMPYVDVADSFEHNSLDFCLIDGLHRGLCTLKVASKIRPTGILVIDNINWYLPSDSRAPASRTHEDGPQSPVWEEARRILSSWRRVWTTSGVTDTAIFFKPCPE